ncbi:internal scaffolding protein [Microviridae sp.]|nr:internal scaffolding protein [Microviridae sp.]
MSIALNRSASAWTLFLVCWPRKNPAGASPASRPKPTAIHPLNPTEDVDMTPLKTTDRFRVQFATTGPSLTHQSMKDECDINRIMLKWQKTGVIDHAKTFQGQYADFTQVTGDYQEHMNAVIEANDMFLTLPATVRKKFDNDPGQFLEFVNDPDNLEDMVELGLATARQDPDPVIEDPTPPKKPNASQKPAPAVSDPKPEGD